MPLQAESRLVRNGSLNQRGAAFTFTAEALAKLRADGWKCPELADWPTWWTGLGANMTVECLREGGHGNDAYLRIGGKDGLVMGYSGHPYTAPSYVLTCWARGRGTLSVGVIAYELSADHRQVVGQVFEPALAPVAFAIDSPKWVRCRRLLRKGDRELSTHMAFSVPTGTVDLDDVDLEPSNPGLDAMVEEEVQCWGKGILAEKLDFVATDAAFRASQAAYREARRALTEKAAAPEPLAKALEAEAARVEPYVLIHDATAVEACHYNEMVVLTRVFQRLAGQSAAPAAAAAVTEAAVRIDHKPGVRPARPDTVTVTDIHSNKVLYEENETATTRATVVNRGSQPLTATLAAVMHLDLDTTREIARTTLTLGAGATQAWSFSYNVGPETYGRGLEVRVVDGTGRLVDTWQEFYAVAAEWFRVQQHTYAGQNKLYAVNPWVTYFNQRHFFASEPTDFGVRPPAVEQYLSGQAGYQVSVAGRQREIDYFRAMGLRHTFYQTFAFCGIMGYEEMRRHPEYVLYDENGQPAVDPIYGGYPNPMELAAPLEMGPKRQADKPYLDRRYTPWQHCAANLAEEDALRYQTARIKEYARTYGFDGVYIDGNMGVWKGYRYDGTLNVPSGKDEDIARLSARNHRLFSAELKRENPNFGTWYNWGCLGFEWARSVGLTTMLGSGQPGDVSDENIRAATAWKNVMILMETGSLLQATEGQWSKPAEFLQILCDQRDFAVQRWGASTIIGYSFIPWKEEEPGPAKWAWPTVNYLGAQMIATQTHHAGGFLPSYRPAFQFMTRYSRLLWAPDIRTVPDQTKMVDVAGPEAVWWKRLVYRRDTADGYDLLVHLVRIPPTERWDYKWVAEPVPLAGLRVTVRPRGATVQSAVCLRPYQFEEPQQPVTEPLAPTGGKRKTTVTVPPFRYHVLVVFRVAGKWRE